MNDDILFLKVRQMVSSVQEDGRYIGQPAFYIDLFDGTDDVKYTQYTVQEFITLFDTLDGNKKHWIIRGNITRHGIALKRVFELFVAKYGYAPFIELKMDGVTIPEEYLQKVISKYNVYIPLKSEQKTDINARVKDSVVEFYKKSNKADFIFGLQSEHDIQEINQFVKLFSIPKGMIYLKTNTNNVMDLNRLQPIVLRHAIQNKYRFCPRINLSIYGNKSQV